MKVYRIVTHVRQSSGSWTPGQVEAVIAAPSRAAAARALGISAGTVAKYASETGNAQDIAQALSAPGTVFTKSPYSDDPWKELS